LYDFPNLARVLDVKVIHCSERDTQVTNAPKQVNEFVNTWSIEGFREEGFITIIIIILIVILIIATIVIIIIIIIIIKALPLLSLDGELMRRGFLFLRYRLLLVLVTRSSFLRWGSTPR
jgi:hypothetical protein